MYDPRPHGRFYYGEGDLSPEDAAAAELLMRRLTNLKGASRIDALRMARTLPSGSVAIAQDAGGTVRLLIYPPEKRPDIPHEGIAESSIPMLFCGAIDQGMAVAGQPIGVHVTAATQRRLGQYDPDRVAGARHNLLRFNCRIPVHLKLFGGELEPFMTQYARIRPTWWSGAMAEVVQIASGYGRQDAENLPDTTIERATLNVPEPYLGRIKRELSSIRLPGYLGVPPENGEITYSPMANITHGVTFDTSGAPWLTQVDRSGVYAMPLPIIPATATEAFREYMDEVGDSEILWALDRFGGLPSGEGFPATEQAKESWRRAGVVIKVCDTDEFYRHDPMTPFCSWTFNSTGNEGFNTATGFDGGLKIPYCAAYKLRLTFSPAENRGWISGESLQGMAQQGLINEYLGGLFSKLVANQDRERAIKYKLRRVDPGMIIARLGRDGAADINYWDNLSLEPIASLRGACAKAGQGYIYPHRLPAFKLPNPYLDGVVSHTMDGLYDSDPPEDYPKCDTILYGYYIGDDLKVVKYFRDDQELDVKEVSDYEDCMTVGEWEKIVYISPARIVGDLYTSDFDERKEVSEEYTRTNVKGVDLGYTGASIYQILSVFAFVFRVGRRRYFGRTTVDERRFNVRRSIYAYAPFFERNALVCGYQELARSDRRKEVASRLFVADPNHYDAWCYDFYRWSWWGQQEPWFNWALMPFETSPPNPFLVMQHFYMGGSPCDDWADNGDWLPPRPVDMSDYFRNGPNWHENYGEVIGGALRYTAQRPGFREYSIDLDDEEEEEHGNFSSIIGRLQKISDREVGSFHFSMSPNEFGNTFYQDASKVAAGLAIYASLSDNGGGPAGGERTRYGHTRMANNRVAQHFIGVINE
jgi:hypothetical protein